MIPQSRITGTQMVGGVRGQHGNHGRIGEIPANFFAHALLHPGQVGIGKRRQPCVHCGLYGFAVGLHGFFAHNILALLLEHQHANAGRRGQKGFVVTFKNKEVQHGNGVGHLLPHGPAAVGFGPYFFGADVNELAPMLDASGVSTATACKVLRELLLAIAK